MMTDAEIVVSGQTATLRKNGWILAARMSRSPRHAVFDKLRCGPRRQPLRSGTNKLIVRLGDKVTDLDLNIILTPYRRRQPNLKLTPSSGPARSPVPTGTKFIHGAKM